MKLSPFVSFGAFTPDLGDYSNPGLIQCTNVIPNTNRYQPWKDIVTTTSALAARPQGGYVYADATGTTHTFAGTGTKLYKLDNSTLAFADVTRASGGDYNVGSESNWCIKAYGNRIIATDYIDAIQSYVVGSSTKFALLSSGAPKARCMGVVNNFVMVGDIDDGSTKYPERVWWCAIDDPTNWPTPRTDAAREVQSDYQDLYGEGNQGKVRAIVGGQNLAVIVKDKAIWRGDYVGSPLVFRFAQVETGHGTKIPTSVIGDGINVYYYDEDGFYQFDGTRSISIDDDIIRDYFRADFLSAFSYRMSTAFDPYNKLIMWSYPSINSMQGAPDKVLVYNILAKRFSIIQIQLSMLLNLLSIGYTMDNIDGFGTMDSIVQSLDSVFWIGGKSQLGAFSTDFKIGTFIGDNLAATIEIGEIQFNEGGRAFISSVMPVTDSPDVTVSLGTRTLQSDTVSYSGVSMPNSQTGECNFRSDSPYHRIKFQIPAGSIWTIAKGYKIKAGAAGEK